VRASEIYPVVFYKSHLYAKTTAVIFSNRQFKRTAVLIQGEKASIAFVIFFDHFMNHKCIVYRCAYLVGRFIAWLQGGFAAFNTAAGQRTFYV
jgi:hypothetical protein